MTDARALALNALMGLGGASAAQSALDRALRKAEHVSGPVDARDAALATELFYGTLRREIQCRWILGRKLRDPQQLPQDVLWLLLMAVYALLFLARVPPYATVDHAVGHARRKYNSKLAGLVNAVLRGISRESARYGDLAFYERECNEAPASLRARAVFYSLPLWIAELWSQAYAPDEFQALLEQSAQAPWTALRLNAAAPGAADLRRDFLQAGCVAVGAFGVCGPAEIMSAFPLADLLQSGRAARHGAGSQAALEAMAPHAWPGPIWDVCCGYGGKSMLLREQGHPLLLASDINQFRLAGLLRQARQRDFADLLVLRADARSLPARSFHGTLLLDAPCSGLGVLAGRPDIKRNRTAQDVADLIGLQAELLRSCFALLAPGARLAYITCARNPAENQKRIAAFLAENSRADLLREWESPINTLWIEGMYGALLSRKY